MEKFCEICTLTFRIDGRARKFKTRSDYKEFIELEEKMNFLETVADKIPLMRESIKLFPNKAYSKSIAKAEKLREKETDGVDKFTPYEDDF